MVSFGTFDILTRLRNINSKEKYLNMGTLQGRNRKKLIRGYFSELEIVADAWWEEFDWYEKCVLGKVNEESTKQGRLITFWPSLSFWAFEKLGI